MIDLATLSKVVFGLSFSMAGFMGNFTPNGESRDCLTMRNAQVHNSEFVSEIENSCENSIDKLTVKMIHKDENDNTVNIQHFQKTNIKPTANYNVSFNLEGYEDDHNLTVELMSTVQNP